MTAWQRGAVALLVPVASLFLSGWGTIEAATISGSAVDLSGNGARGVTVEIIADRAILATGTTDNRGQFTIKARDVPVISIRFSAGGRVGVTLTNLNGRVDQRISVVVPGGGS
jgi:hypothetical protein